MEVRTLMLEVNMSYLNTLAKVMLSWISKLLTQDNFRFPTQKARLVGANFLRAIA